MRANELNSIFEGDLESQADTILQNMIDKDAVNPEDDLDTMRAKILKSLKAKDNKYKKFAETLSSKSLSRLVNFLGTAKSGDGRFIDVVQSIVIENCYNGDIFNYKADKHAPIAIAALMTSVTKDLVKSVTNAINSY